MLRMHLVSGLHENWGGELLYCLVGRGTMCKWAWGSPLSPSPRQPAGAAAGSDRQVQGVSENRSSLAWEGSSLLLGGTFTLVLCYQSPYWEGKKTTDFGSKTMESILPPAAVNSTAAVQNYKSQNTLHSMTSHCQAAASARGAGNGRVRHSVPPTPSFWHPSTQVALMVCALHAQPTLWYC